MAKARTILPTIATFRGGDFHATAEERIDAEKNGPGCFGAGLLDALTKGLERLNAVAGQRDLVSSGGWNCPVRFEGERMWIHVARFEDGDRWMLAVETHRNFVLQLLGRKNSRALPALVRHIADVLASLQEISDVRWHDDQDRLLPTQEMSEP